MHLKVDVKNNAATFTFFDPNTTKKLTSLEIPNLDDLNMIRSQDFFHGKTQLLVDLGLYSPWGRSMLLTDLTKKTGEDLKHDQHMLEAFKEFISNDSDRDKVLKSMTLTDGGQDLGWNEVIRVRPEIALALIERLGDKPPVRVMRALCHPSVLLAAPDNVYNEIMKKEIKPRLLKSITKKFITHFGKNINGADPLVLLKK